MLALGQGVKLDKKIAVAAFAVEALRGRGAKEFQSLDTKSVAELGDRREVIGDERVHVKIVPRVPGRVKIRLRVKLLPILATLPPCIRQ